MTSPVPAKPRPLSPHLGIYKPQISTVMSILHRATGVALGFGMLVLTAWIVMLAGGADTYSYFTGNLDYALGCIGLVGAVFIALWYALNCALCGIAQSSKTLRGILGLLAYVGALAIAVIAEHVLVAAFPEGADKVFDYAGLAILAGITWSFFYHFFCGIRHLMWDAGWFLTIRGMHITGWITVLLSLLPTLAIWLKIEGYLP